MHWIGLGLLLAAAIALVFALRGRIVARGRFCRKCRFDLHGLDQPACPECGGDLARPGATRPTLRRASRAGLAGSVVLALIAASLAFLSMTNTARLMAALPDGPVVLMAGAGVDDALTELVTRVDRTPPMEPRHWAKAIDAGLAHQADHARSWDVRWGTVLAHALLGSRMTSDQLAAYVENGYEITARFRDRVQHGDGRIAMSIRYEAARMSANTPDHNGLRTPVRLRFRLIGAGWTDRAGRAHAMDDRVASLWIPPAASQFPDRSTPGMIEMDAPWDEVCPGDRLRLFTAFELIVIPEHGRDEISVGVHRFEQEVRVLGPNEPVIAVSDDPQLSDQIRAELRPSGLKAFLPMINPDAEPETRSQQLAYVMFSVQDLPIGLAGAVSVRIGDEEWPLGRLSWGSASVNAGVGHLISVPWRVEPENLDEAAGVVRRWIAAGEVDLIFRTEPELAIGNLSIDRVQDIELLYEGVRVKHEGFPGNSVMYIYGEQLYTASPHPPPEPPATP